MEKMLIIRFSSFGDIVQSLVVAKKVKEKYPDCKITWLTKENFSGLVGLCPHVDDIKVIRKGEGFFSLIKLGLSLKSENFEVLYDAHSNLRSFFIKLMMTPMNFSLKCIVRKKERWKRFLLFKLRKNKFDYPYRGMISYLKPLAPLEIRHDNLTQNWNFKKPIQDKVKSLFPKIDESFIVLAPSAAWKMKRWPEENWKKLIANLKNQHVVLVGGPGDDFIDNLYSAEDSNCLNLAGKLSLEESCYLVSRSKALISADTGMIHVADLLGTRGLSLIGPTAFGFPTNSNIKTLEVDLPCRPCSKDGRGKCSREIYQECMVKITPENVLEEIQN